MEVLVGIRKRKEEGKEGREKAGGVFREGKI